MMRCDQWGTDLDISIHALPVLHMKMDAPSISIRRRNVQDYDKLDSTHPLDQLKVVLCNCPWPQNRCKLTNLGEFSHAV
jgi:hypothetical protein